MTSYARPANPDAKNSAEASGYVARRTPLGVDAWGEELIVLPAGPTSDAAPGSTS
jgi:hypothetical protein